MINYCYLDYRLNTDRKLFQALKSVANSKDKFPTTDVDDHVVNLFLFDFEQCGIHLEEKQRLKVCVYAF